MLVKGAPDIIIIKRNRTNVYAYLSDILYKSAPLSYNGCTLFSISKHLALGGHDMATHSTLLAPGFTVDSQDKGPVMWRFWSSLMLLSYTNCRWIIDLSVWKLKGIFFHLTVYRDEGKIWVCFAEFKNFPKPCHPGGDSWNYYSGSVSLSQVTLQLIWRSMARRFNLGFHDLQWVMDTWIYCKVAG